MICLGADISSFWRFCQLGRDFRALNNSSAFTAVAHCLQLRQRIGDALPGKLAAKLRSTLDLQSQYTELDVGFDASGIQ
jgi:hypothetical protein